MIKYLLFPILSIGLFSIPNSEEALSRQGKDFALFFAVKDYDQWGDLRNPIGDAEAVAAELKSEYGFQTEVVRNPSRNQIYQTLERYRSMTFPADGQLLIFFSGHGDFREESLEGFFVPKDGLLNDPFQDSYIPHTRLERIVDNLPAPHIMLAIDACFSGTFDEQIARDRGRLGQRPGEDQMSQAEQFIRRKLKHRSRLYLTSGGKERTPDGQRHSPFTEKLLEGLRSYGIGDGILTFTELLGFMEQAQPAPKAGQFGSHAPGGTFLFITSDIPTTGPVFATPPRTTPPNREDNTTKPPVSKPNTKPRNENASSATMVVDSRDSKRYPVVQLNGQTWLAENLNFDIGGSGSWCYNRQSQNCEKYGRLYTWPAAKEACEGLGDGWHLPSQEEWASLARLFGGNENESDDYGEAASKALRQGGKSGFNAMLGGLMDPTNEHTNIGKRGAYWSATSMASYPQSAEYHLFTGGPLYTNAMPKTGGMYCRCVK